MAIKTKEELYTYYKSGDKTTEGQWFDLIDSLFNILDNGDDLNPYTYNRILFVDAAATLDAPVKGQLIRPYASVNDAYGEAVSGDLIVIFAGTYNCNNLFKDGVSYYAFPGVVLVNDALSSSDSLFTDTIFTEGGFCRLMGYAELQLNNYAALIGKPETVFQLQCDRILYLHQGMGYVPLFYLTNAVSVDIDVRKIDSYYPFIRIFAVSDVSISIKCDELTTVYPLNIAAFSANEKENVEWHVQINKIESSLNIDTADTLFSISSMPMTSKPKFYLSDTVLDVFNTALIHVDGAEAYVENVRFISKGGSWSPGIYVFSHYHYIPGTSGFIAIKNSEIIMEHEITPLDQRVFNPVVFSNYKVIGVLTSNMNLYNYTHLFSIGEYNYDAEFGLN